MKSITDLILSLFLITLFSGALMGTAFAEKSTDIYKWVDADGRVHYAARPGNSSAEKMNMGSKTFHRNDNKDSQKKEAEKKKDAERAKLCQDSKDTLEKYKKAPFLYRYDEERKQKVRLTEAENKETFLQAEKDVSYWCNPLQKTESKDKTEDEKK